MSDNNANSAVILPKYPRVQAKLNPAGQAQYWTADEMVALHAVLAEKDATIDDLRAQLATAQRASQQQDSDWLAMMRAIAALTNDEWSIADDDALWEQFDPWQALREIGGQLATLQAATPVGLDFPDGPGWWAFEGDLIPGNGSDNQVYHHQDVCEVFMFYDRLTAWMTRKGIWAIANMKGKWTRLHMPWEATHVAEGEGVQPDWLAKFPPEWDRHPWANYAYLQMSFSSMDGISAMWYYYECEPEWGERSWNWVDGKHGWANPVKRAPLSTFFDVKATLQRRPHAQQDSQGVSDE